MFAELVAHAVLAEHAALALRCDDYVPDPRVTSFRPLFCRSKRPLPR